MSQTTAQSRTVETTDAGSEGLRRAGFFAHHRSGSSAYLRHRRLGAHSAYTLIEVLIVASIVVLMLGMALPVFRAITGSRSEAGASNIIQSVLGRARTDAIGLNKPMGVAFLYNQTTQQSYLAEVDFAECQVWTNGTVVPPLGYFSSAYQGLTYYFINNSGSNLGPLTAPPTTSAPSAPMGSTAVGGAPIEIRQDTELLPLPTGIGVQTICNCNFNNGTRSSDGYLNLGVILFDGNGRMLCQNYAVSGFSKLSTTSGLNGDYPVTNQNIGYNGQFGVPSQVGLVVFQREAFVAQNFPTADPAYTTANANQSSAYASQKAEEDWLDQNATPLLIDRYTGTLIRGE